MRHHRELLEERLRGEGWSEEAARQKANEWLGRGLESAERKRGRGGGMRIGEWIGGWVQDVRIGVRGLLRRPGYTVACTLALGIGLGGSALVLSLVDGIFLRPVPVQEIDRVVSIHELTSAGSPFPVSYPAFLDYRAGVGPGVEMAGWRSMELGVAVGERRAEVDAAAVSGGWFGVLGLRPAVGRLIDPADDTPGGEAVVVLGHDLWASRFGADPDVVGRVIEVGAGSARILGVAPEGFRGLRLDRDEQLWFPIGSIRALGSGLYASPNVLETRFFTWVYPIARLDADVAPETVSARLATVRARLVEALGPDGRPEVAEPPPPFVADPLRETALGGDQERLFGFLALVTGLSFFTLVVGTLNAMQLRLAHLRSRAGEIGVRRALGASRGRVVRQVALDVVPMVVGAGGVGLLLAQGVLAALRRFTLPGGVSLGRLPLELDVWTLGLLTVAAGWVVVMSGLVPAWLGTRRDPSDQMRGRSRRAAGTGFVTAQVALSTALVVAAALFVRSFDAGVRTPLGFEPDGVVALTVSPRAHGMDRSRETIQRMSAVVEAVPGVRAFALASHLPLSPSPFDSPLIPLGEAETRDRPRVNVNAVAGAFHETLEIRIVEGDPLDTGGDDERTAVVNRAAAEILFPGRSPIGRYLKVFAFERDSVRIVGVAEDTRATSVADPAPPFLWMDARAYGGLSFNGTAHLVARVEGDPAAALGRLQRALAAGMPGLPAVDPRPLRAQVTRALMPQHLGAILFGVFGLFAALLAATGVAGVTAFELTRRRREMGIRAALGATFLRRSLPAVRATAVATAAGMVLGVGLTVLAGSRLRAFLYGIELLDPMSLAAATLALAVSAATATAWSLHRHGRIETARLLSEANADMGAR